MRRFATFLRQQRRAWTMLLAPEPKPFVWSKVSGDGGVQQEGSAISDATSTAFLALSWLCHGGEFATWVADKEMPWAAAREYDHAVSVVMGILAGRKVKSGGISSLAYCALRSRAAHVADAVRDLRGREPQDQSTLVVCNELMLRDCEIHELLARIRDLETATRDLVEILVSNFEADELAADGRYVAARATLETP